MHWFDVSFQKKKKKKLTCALVAGLLVLHSSAKTFKRSDCKHAGS